MDRQQEEKIEKLATKVMGWHWYDEGEWWQDAEGKRAAWEAWNPWLYWHDAGMVFDKVKENPEQWQGFVYHLCLEGTQPISQLLRRLTPAAIAEAALKVCDE